MRTVVITGVSRGLGAAFFARLAGRPDERIFAIGRHFTPDQRARAAAEPARITLYEADLADPATLPDAATLWDALSGSAENVLIHNAGTVEPVGPVGMLPPAAVTSAVAVNLTAVMVLTGAFVAALPDGTDTRILYISSGAAHRVIESWAVYSATKRGAEMFLNAVAVQLPDAYVVNVNPGVMDTDMQAVLRRTDFPDHDRYAGLHERGELPDPATVADRIIAAHLDQPITHE